MPKSSPKLDLKFRFQNGIGTNQRRKKFIIFTYGQTMINEALRLQRF